jgi:hypothetical protein
MADRQSVKVYNAALDEVKGGEIILRGVIDHDSLDLLQVDDYQRKAMTGKKIKELQKALLTRSGVPDITLGVRADTYTERGGAFYLDPVYIIDGLQRVTAARQLLLCDPHSPFRLGGLFHFGTTEEIERNMFEALNVHQTRLSPNVTLRNQRYNYEVADALYRLSSSMIFVMSDRISWEQHMKRGDLITALSYFKVAGMLHSHLGSGRGSNALELVRGLEKIMAGVGQNKFVSNVREFFDIVHQAWGVRDVAYREGASYLKSAFMLALARIFSDHTNFWREDRLTVDKQTVDKLKLFKVYDPYIADLASTGGVDIIYDKLVKHINSGRRTKRLKPRMAPMEPYDMTDDEVDDEEVETDV